VPRRFPDRLVPERELWAAGWRCFAGIDEAGRGPLAGPVVAAAVVLPTDWIRSGMPAGLRDLNDSKQLTEAQREEFFGQLTTHPGVAFGIAESAADEIDAINILQATHRAMNRALERLPTRPDHALVDGRPVKTLALAHTALVKGDARSYSIAAASVLAKVTRDRAMLAAHARWPDYGFDRHKGYPTPEHLAALRVHGPCPIHRRSFAPIRPVQGALFPA
jgi:ribonuclease HII